MQNILKKVIEIDEELCNGCGNCIIACSEGVIAIVNGKAKVINEPKCDGLGACIGECPTGAIKIVEKTIESNLTNWPIKIHLIPSNAPFLRNANLLICADCVAIAYPNIHKSLLKDKKVMIGCPKLDNGGFYLEKFADIFGKASLTSVTVAVMEVPCCKRMLNIIKKAKEISGENLKIEAVIISIEGEILDRFNVTD